MWPLIRMGLVLTGALVFQAAVVPHMAIAGAKPDIILVVAVLYGFTFGSRTGAFAGFFGGLLGDLLSGLHVGIGVISKTTIGFLAGLVQRTIFVESIFLPMLAIFVATFLNEFVYVSFMFLFGETTPIKEVILKLILPSAAYNAVLMPFVYGAIRKLMVVKQETPIIKVIEKYE